MCDLKIAHVCPYHACQAEEGKNAQDDSGRYRRCEQGARGFLEAMDAECKPWMLGNEDFRDFLTGEEESVASDSSDEEADEAIA